MPVGGYSDVLQPTLVEFPAELSEGLFVNNSVRLQALVSLSPKSSTIRGVQVTQAKP
jgi:hypothetical protein